MFTLDEAKKVIADKDEFKVVHKKDYVVIDYVIQKKDTFVGKTSRETWILQNLRGTAFSADSGKIISLPFQKFHNLNECKGYMEDEIDFTMPHQIQEKLDGSMIRVIPTTESKLGFVFGTRMGETDVSAFVDEWLENHPNKKELIDYIFNLCCHEYTPIFEFTSRKNKVVIDYPTDNLTLLAIRCNFTGVYADIKDVEIPSCLDIVKEVIFCDIKDVYRIKDREGIVIAFDSGFRVKVKAEEYVRKHKAKDMLKFEKDVVKLIVENNVDDILPLLSTNKESEDHLSDREKLDLYRDTFMELMASLTNKVKKEVIWIKANFSDRKEQANYILKNHKKIAKFLFAGLDDKDLGINEYIVKQCSSSTKIEQCLEDLQLPCWYEYY